MPTQPEQEEQELPLDLGDPKQAKAHNETAEDWEQERLDFLKTAMTSKSGRRFFSDLVFVKCHINHNSFNSDHALHSFADGERNVGQRVQTEILQVAPESFVTMLKENGAANV